MNNSCNMAFCGAVAAVIILAIIPQASAETATCAFGVDYRFIENPSGEHIETFNGWIFTIEPVMNYTIFGVVLDTNVYSKNNASEHPIDVISPIDAFIGVDRVMEDYEYFSDVNISWQYRTVVWSHAEEPWYFRSHSSNNHLIPHNLLAYRCMLNLSAGDNVEISGRLVDVHGERGERDCLWETDDRIRNPNCEIILVDNMTVNGVEWDGLCSGESEPEQFASASMLGMVGGLSGAAALAAWVADRRRKYNPLMAEKKQ